LAFYDAKDSAVIFKDNGSSNGIADIRGVKINASMATSAAPAVFFLYFQDADNYIKITAGIDGWNNHNPKDTRRKYTINLESYGGAISARYEKLLTEGQEWILGREMLPLPEVSRSHFKIKILFGKVWIFDLKSSNGLYSGVPFGTNNRITEQELNPTNTETFFIPIKGQEPKRFFAFNIRITVK
jgi:hypothetical protein